MARKPEFNRDEVLVKAMHVFWAQGFESATVKSVGDATGLQPGSLYAAFGDKNGLFRAALQRYVAEVRSLMPKSCSGRQLLERWFAAHLERAFHDGQGRGCLLLNSLMGIQGLDAESAALVESEFRKLLCFFEHAVAEARRGPCGETESALATSLIAALCGISVLARSGTAPDTLQAVARIALRAV